MIELTHQQMSIESNKQIMVDALQRISERSDDSDLMPFINQKNELNIFKRQRQNSVQVFPIGMLVAAFIHMKVNLNMMDTLDTQETVIENNDVRAHSDFDMTGTTFVDYKIINGNNESLNILNVFETQDTAFHENPPAILDTHLRDTKKLFDPIKSAVFESQCALRNILDPAERTIDTLDSLMPISLEANQIIQKDDIISSLDRTKYSELSTHSESTKPQAIVVRIKSYCHKTQLYTVIDPEIDEPEEIHMYQGDLRDFSKFEEYRQGTKVMALYETDPAIYSTEFYEAKVLKRHNQHVKIIYADGEIAKVLATQVFEMDILH